MTTPRQPPAGPSEALPVQAEGADARSPSVDMLAHELGLQDEDEELLEVLRHGVGLLERAAESRGAKAGRAEAAEYLERCAQDMRMRGAPWTGFGLLVMHAQRIRSLSAEGAPSGSPSVPAAQPRTSIPHADWCYRLALEPAIVDGVCQRCYPTAQANQGAPTREAPEPGGALTERPAWAQLVDGALALLEPAERRARQVSQTVVGPSVVQIGAATFLVAVDSLRDALSRAQPRAAPSDSAPATPGLGQPSAGSAEAEEFAKYHEERARWPGASREFHERAASFLRCASGEPRVAPSSPESPAVAADAGDRNHE